MKAFIVVMGLSMAVGSAASAQLAPFEAGGAPAPLDGVAGVGVPSTAVPREDTPVSSRDCFEQARSFHARNTQSPSRREHALAECLAAVVRPDRVEVAGP